jgi:general secretion pathway protein L
MTITADHKPKRSRAEALARRAFAWWLSELGAAWQDVASRLDRGTRNGATIEAGERYWILRQGRQVLGQIDRPPTGADSNRRVLLDLIPSSARRRPIIVEIPQERVLSRHVMLPAAARPELDRILEFEIARHFPFPAERAFFCHRVAGHAGYYRPPGSGPIDVELVAVPREIVDEIRRELAGNGVYLGKIAVAGRSDKDRLLLPSSAVRGEQRSSLAPVNRALGFAVGGLAIAAIVSAPLQQHLRLAAVEPEIEALKPQAQTVLDARDRQRLAADRTASVLRLRAVRPPLVAVLAELSRTVPDGSWLISLGLSGREINMDGLSPSAATTALALEQSRIFSNVVFRSSITRDPATGLEHFQLSAAISGPAP